MKGVFRISKSGTRSPPVDLHWFFEISIRTEKKNSVRTEKKIQLELKKKSVSLY